MAPKLECGLAPKVCEKSFNIPSIPNVIRWDGGNITKTTDNHKLQNCESKQH